MTTIAIHYDGTDITPNVVYEESRFTARANGQVGEADIVVKDLTQMQRFTPGKTLELFIDGSREWDGFLMRQTRTYWFASHTAECNPCPHVTPRKITLHGLDRNVLLEKRVLYDHDTPNDLSPGRFTAGTSDQTVIRQILGDYSDLAADGIDISSQIDVVGSPDPWQDFQVAGPGYRALDPLEQVRRQTGGVYYITPDRVLVYTDVDTADAPFGLSDRPAGTRLGCREIEITFDCMQMANDAMVWGAGTGSPTMVYSRVEDASSIAVHGRWQNHDGYHANVYKQESADHIANTIVYGSPSNKRGHKDNKVSVHCSLFTPGLRVAQKVDFQSQIFGFSDVIPVREMTISFPTSTACRYDVVLSHDFDQPWNTAEYWRPTETTILPPWTACQTGLDMGPMLSLSTRTGDGVPPEPYFRQDTFDWYHSIEPHPEGINGSDVVDAFAWWPSNWRQGGSGEVFNYSDPSCGEFFLYAYQDYYGVIGNTRYREGPLAFYRQKQLKKLAANVYDGPQSVILRCQLTLSGDPQTRPYQGENFNGQSPIGMPPMSVRIGVGPNGFIPQRPTDIRVGEGWNGTYPYSSAPPVSPILEARLTTPPQTSVNVPVTLYWSWRDDFRPVYLDTSFPNPPDIFAAAPQGYGFCDLWSIIPEYRQLIGGQSLLLPSGQPCVERPVSGSMSAVATDLGGGYYALPTSFVAGSIRVYIDGIYQRPGTDYEEYPSLGWIRFRAPVSGPVSVTYDIWLTPDDLPVISTTGVYRPTFVPQLGWGSINDGYNCRMAAACMLLDRHTLGTKTDNPVHMRGCSGVENYASTTFQDAQRAWGSCWQEQFGYGTMGWSEFIKLISEPRGALVDGLYASLDPAYRSSATFMGGHSVYVNERNADGAFLVYDPLAGGARYWPADVLRSYAEAWSNGNIAAGFTRVTLSA